MESILLDRNVFREGEDEEAGAEGNLLLQQHLPKHRWEVFDFLRNLV